MHTTERTAKKSAATKKAPAKARAKKNAAPPAGESIITYKGFDSQLRCREFKFVVGKTYTHDGEVKACAGGFHACEHPLNVFSYYPPAGSRFAVVEQSGTLSRHDEDTKVASSRITIKAEIGIPGLVKAAIEYVTSRCKPIEPESPAQASGYQGAAQASGDQGAAQASGLASVAMAVGFYGKARGSSECAIVLVNRADDGSIRHIRASKVGENGIKPDVWYTLSSAGEFVEVQP